MRSQLGVCPQHDVLFDELTAIENLHLFGALKGLTPSEIEKESHKLLQQVGLEEKTHALSNTLSGGQKRKLSLAVALIGSPKLLILDEISTGVDAYSRRKIWELLQAKKRHCSIILCTHFMEEAELLADRIAVMSHGRIQCLGTNLFLKNRFGIGYHLLIEVKQGDTNKKKQIEKLVQENCPNSKISRRFGSSSNETLDFALPFESVSSFPQLFSILETDKMQSANNDSLVSAYSLAQPTLEEVFLKLEDLQADENLTEGIEKRASPSNMKSEEKGNVADQHVWQSPPMLKRSQQVKALALARFRNTYRAPVFYIVVVLFPIAFLIFGLAFATNNVSVSQTPLVLNQSLFLGAPQSELTFVNQTQSNMDPFLNALGFSNNHQFNSSSGMLQYLLNNAVSQTTYGISGLVIESNQTFQAFYNSTYTHYMAYFVNAIASALYVSEKSNSSKWSGIVEATSWPFSEPSISINSAVITSMIFIALGLSFSSSSWMIEVILDRENKVDNLLRVQGMSRLMYWLSFFIVDICMATIAPIVFIILFYAFNVDGFVGIATFPLVILFALYAISIVLMNYCISFIFDKAESAQRFAPPLISILALVPYMVVVSLDLVKKIPFFFCG